LARETLGRAGRVALALLFANLVLLNSFLALQYWGGRDRALPEFNADKIQLLDQPKQAVKTAVQEAAPPSATPLGLCYRVNNMDQARYQEFREAMNKLDLEAGRLRLITDNALPWWVYWPPEYEAAQRDSAIKKFGLAGVRQVLPIKKGAMAQSFALGLYPDEARARAQRDALRQKGLDKAEYGIRPAIGGFILHLTPPNEARQEALKALMPAWAELLETQACGG
jgi:hypothetical protein